MYGLWMIRTDRTLECVAVRYVGEWMGEWITPRSMWAGLPICGRACAVYVLLCEGSMCVCWERGDSMHVRYLFGGVITIVSHIYSRQVCWIHVDNCGQVWTHVGQCGWTRVWLCGEHGPQGDVHYLSWICFGELLGVW